MKARFAVGLFLFALACGAPSPRTTPEADAIPGVSERAHALFQKHCTVCHGSTGHGDGPVAMGLWPPPRDFADASFALVSTTNGMPTDDDLIGSIRRGMPGSAMPSFEWMDDGDLQLLATHVRQLALEGAVQRSALRALSQGQDVDEAALRREVALRLTPTAEVPVPPAADPTDAVLARGEALYLQDCAACHGIDGRGRRAVQHWADRDRYRWARDFTFGVTKGDVSQQALAHRIFAGMPASGMPPTEYDAASDRAALIAFVRSLLQPGQAERLVQHQRRLRASWVQGDLPEDPDDPRWESVRLVLAPLVWKFDAVLEAQVALLHNGSELAALVRWHDDSQDDRAISGSASGDGVALQFSDEVDPPVFAMGGPHSPVSIWHWQPFRAADVAGFLDPLENPPHVDSPVLRPYPGVFRRDDSATAGRAAGPPSVSRLREDGQAIVAKPRYRDGMWEVVLRGPLATLGDGKGSRRIACAIWNGAVGDRRGEKSVTMWHELVIE